MQYCLAVRAIVRLLERLDPSNLQRTMMTRHKRFKLKCFEHWVWNQFDSTHLQLPLHNEPIAPATNKHLHPAAAALDGPSTCLRRACCKSVSSLQGHLACRFDDGLECHYHSFDFRLWHYDPGVNTLLHPCIPHTSSQTAEAETRCNTSTSATSHQPSSARIVVLLAIPQLH